MKNAKLSILLSLILFVFSNSYAQKNYYKKPQFVKGEIVFEDKTTVSGFVRVPKAPSDNYVFFKSSEDAKAEKYHIDLINYFQVETNSGNQYHFDILPIKIMERDLSRGQAVLLKKTEGYATAYFVGNTYKLSKEGEIGIFYEYNAGTDFPTFNYYIKKKGEDFARFFAMTSSSKTVFGMNKQMKENASKLLSEHKELVKRINNDEFQHQEIDEILKIYNDYMKGR